MKILRFVTIMLTALSLSAAFAHLLEMSAKLTYDGELWLNLLQTLYPTFGQVSGLCEIGAEISSLVLLFACRKRRPALQWTSLAVFCLVATHTIFWIWVAPVNAALVPLTPQTLPPDWTSLRAQWEYGHASRAILQILALAALIISLLAEIPPAVQATAESEHKHNERSK